MMPVISQAEQLSNFSISEFRWASSHSAATVSRADGFPFALEEARTNWRSRNGPVRVCALRFHWGQRHIPQPFATNCLLVRRTPLNHRMAALLARTFAYAPFSWTFRGAAHGRSVALGNARFRAAHLAGDAVRARTNVEKRPLLQGNSQFGCHALELASQFSNLREKAGLVRAQGLQFRQGDVRRCGRGRRLGLARFDRP